MPKFIVEIKPFHLKKMRKWLSSIESIEEFDTDLDVFREFFLVEMGYPTFDELDLRHKVFVKQIE